MPKIATKSRVTKSKKAPVPFSQSLVLNQFMLQLLGFDSFIEIANQMKQTDIEGWDSENVSGFYYHLSSILPIRAKITSDMLRQYDENITTHTLQIKEKRQDLVTWKYFQYLSLLFTEIYLDRYFSHKENLLAELNGYLMSFNDRKGAGIEPYSLDDLRKLAFWNATGSGKTLLMHVNIKQYLHYWHKYEKVDDLSRIILLTPKEDLSKQHLREFELSGIHGELFEKDQGSLFRQQAVTIINIQRIREESGEKTVAVDVFEGNNLVLVDEGHRGSSGDEWKRMRDRLSETGFAFEYSATFGQAVSGKKGLEQEYAKCILFDYSYKYFYKDGYGKDYKILNLENDSDPSIRRLYLTACLLSFYQQLKLFQNDERTMREFLIEKPLWIFVGKTVSATAKKDKEQEVSDVLDILLFIAEFAKERQQHITLIERLLSGSPGLTDEAGREIFRNTFSYLSTLSLSPEVMYQDVLRTVFNSLSTEATLHIVDLKGVEGEIALKLGENEPFGVINVGETSKLCSICDAFPEQMTVSSQSFFGSLFHKLDNRSSSINLLIGSKKFTEGWSSWRVSTMGLMNIGRSEGAEIIQLFGRGVRLKGHGSGLKRSSHVSGVQVPPFIDVLETLTIFGVRADYMRQFRDYLEDEGISKQEIDTEIITLPVKKDYLKRSVELKTLALKDGVDYKKQGTKPTLDVREDMTDLGHIIVDWYPKIQVAESRRKVQESLLPGVQDSCKFLPEHLAFMNMERIYFEMQRYKKERRWFNLRLEIDKLRDILVRTDWYTLYIPKEEMILDTFTRIAQWEEIALTLLKKYCEQYYVYHRKEWEAPHLVYKNLSEDDNNFISEYRITYHLTETTLKAGLQKLKKSLETGVVTNLSFAGLEIFEFDLHLYQPLIYLNDGNIQVSPAPLNVGENRFIKDLNKYYTSNTVKFQGKQIYLLRNQSKKGIGFFEAGGFYPDFILWILFEGKQYISFIDPKGIKYHSITDKKLQFYRTVKEKEAQIMDASVVLNSFIISNTLYSKLTNTGTTLTMEQFEERNILFQNEQAATYIEKMLKKIIPNW